MHTKIKPLPPVMPTLRLTNTGTYVPLRGCAPGVEHTESASGNLTNSTNILGIWAPWTMSKLYNINWYIAAARIHNGINALKWLCSAQCT